jgi:hypothetical protein
MEAMQKHDGETTMQMVGIPVRILCGLVGSVFGGFSVYGLVQLLLEGIDHWELVPVMLFTLLVAGGFLWIAAKGWRQLVIDPVASERFFELADPARPIPPGFTESTAESRARPAETAVRDGRVPVRREGPSSTSK